MPLNSNGFLARLLAPEVALPIAAGLLGQQGNGQNFANALGMAGPAIAQQKQLQAQTAQSNKTLEFLRKNSPDIAAQVDAGMPVPEAWKMYNDSRTAKKGQGFINAGGGNLFNSDTGEWVSAPGGGSEGAAGLQTVWLRDKDGNPVIGQLTKDGKVLQSQMPEGLQPVGPYDLNFERGKGTAAGKGVGEAQTALPGATMTAARVAQQVDDLKNDPYLPSMIGPMNSRLPNITADAGRVQSKINQLKGGAFLEARQALKGGGAITDYEGAKAEAAYARLEQAQSVEDFQAALDEFNMYVQQGLMKLQAQSGQQGLGNGVRGAPQPQGGAVDYKTKYGLD